MTSTYKETKTQNKIPTKLESVYMVGKSCNNGVNISVSVYSSFKELLMAIIKYINEEDHLNGPMVEKHYQLTEEYDESIMLDAHLIKSCKDYNWEECKKYFSNCFSLEIDYSFLYISKNEINDRLGSGLYIDRGSFETRSGSKEFDIDTLSRMIFTFGTFPIKEKMTSISDENPDEDTPIVVKSTLTVYYTLEVEEDIDGKYLAKISNSIPYRFVIDIIDCGNDEPKYSTSKIREVKGDSLSDRDLTDIEIAFAKKIRLI